MKFRIFSALLLSGIFTIQSMAATISLGDAEKAGRNFLFLTLNKYGNGAGLTDISLVPVYTHYSGGEPVFYAFDTRPGFILVSADNAFTPILGYSFEGNFEFEQAPAHYRGFIRNYAEQIDYIRQNGIAPSPEYRAEWTELLGEAPGAEAITRERDVEPLLMQNWDQGSPYNLLCPADPNGPGGHTWAGCVATAMAQIMYYWRYPITGTGQHCYYPGNYSYGQQCANFGQTTYQWTGMNNSIDSRNPVPNAELQYHCAVSVNMNFSPNGSGSYSYLVPDRLDQFFRYNDAEYEEKQYFSSSGWISLLKADIDQGHPLYYSGYNPSDGGHAFVCDGYQGDNFHFNFGWSGSGNGYYTLSNVGGFYQGQAVVRNFVPSDPNYPYYASGQTLVTQKSGSITDGSGPVNNYPDNLTASWLINPQTLYDSITSVTIEFPMFDVQPGDTLRIYDGGSTSDGILGSYSGTSVPAEVTSSSNQMLITFTTNGSGASKGWYAEYTSTSPTWCSGLTQLTEPSGTFDDGSGDFYYQSGATCMWRIKPEDAGTITLNFNYFDTEADNDKLTIFDGTTKIAEFSGSQVPSQITATSGLMFITWSTNQAENHQGWEAWYEIDNVGVSDNISLPGLTIFPNPADDLFNIAFNSLSGGTVVYHLKNPAGVKVAELRSIESPGRVSRQLSVSHLAPGIYILEISTQEGTVNKKLIVR